METKGTLHNRFTSEVIAKKINLTAAQTNAVTIFFGMENSTQLITQRSVALYNEGEQLANKILNRKLTCSHKSN